MIVKKNSKKNQLRTNQESNHRPITYEALNITEGTRHGHVKLLDYDFIYLMLTIFKSDQVINKLIHKHK